MSAWKIRLRRLYDAGGGPLQRRAFDPMDTVLDDETEPMGPAIRHGLVTSQRVKFVWLWTLTPRGRDWCEGRITLTEEKRGTSGRGKMQTVATWLSALPRAGEIRL